MLTAGSQKPVQPKKPGDYTYAVLVTQKLDRKPKSQSLGNPGSQKHRHWKEAIRRRDAIVELEQQLAMLQTLIGRQARTCKDLGIPDWVNSIS